MRRRRDKGEWLEKEEGWRMVGGRGGRGGGGGVEEERWGEGVGWGGERWRSRRGVKEKGWMSRMWWRRGGE